MQEPVFFHAKWGDVPVASNYGLLGWAYFRSFTSEKRGGMTRVVGEETKAHCDCKHNTSVTCSEEEEAGSLHWG